MGMESYSVLVISENVENTKENGMWGLHGKSDLEITSIDMILKKMGANLEGKGRWLLDNCIEITEYEEGGFFQGIEFKGCLAWFDEGIEIVFNCIQGLLDILPNLDVFILSQKIQIGSSEELRDMLNELYKDKIAMFKRQYGKVQLKATCGAFYKEMEKREKWYYKLFHHQNNER